MSKIKLGDIANITKLAGFEHTKYIQGNCTHKKITSDDMPLFIGKTVRNGKIDTNFDWYISKDISNSLERSQLNKKCIVLPYVGTIGDLAIYDGTYPAHLGSNIAKIELNDNCGYTEEFIYYFLKSPYGQTVLLRDIQGAIQKNITMGAIRAVELPNISVDEQKRIVSSIKCIDDRIENNNKINAELESMAKTIYDYWFLQFEFPNEEGKPYKSSGGKMVWNEELKREIPEGWEAIVFNKLFRFEKGKIPNSLSEIKNEENDYPYITIDVANGGSPQYCSSENMIYCNGETIMVMDGAASGDVYVGNTGILGSTFAMLSPINSKMTNSFIYWILKSNSDIYKKANTGSTVPHANRKYIESMKIALPNDINKMTGIFDDLQNKINHIKMENQELASLRDFLLPMLMNGQIGFKDGE